MDSFLRSKRKKNAILRAKDVGVRRRCVKEWDILTDEQKVLTRSMRAKKGIKCEECGNVGYYTEICPKGCYKPEETVEAVGLARFDTNDDDEDKPVGVGASSGDGFLWYKDYSPEDENGKNGTRKKIHGGNKKADLNPLKDQMRSEMSRLRETDSSLSDYVFYRDAGEGYARDFSELNLHQALRRLMRVLEREIEVNITSLETSVDVTLFHPPARKIGEDFYPEDIGKIKEYRDYFTQQKVKKDRLYQAYQHKGSLRPEHSLDGVCRNPKGQSSTKSLYETDKKAGQSMHSKIGWKDILSKGDDLAIADPAMAAKVAGVEKLMRKQGAWTEKQKQAFIQTNERYTHMWHIIKEEIHKEHDRERRLLSVDVHSNLEKTEQDIWKERIDSADRIMATITGYGFTNGTNDADYAIYCIQKWKDEIVASKLRRSQRIAKGTVDKLDIAAANAAAARKKRQAEERRKKRGRKQTRGKMVRSIAATRIGSPQEGGDGEDENDDDEKSHIDGNDDDTVTSAHSSSMSMSAVSKESGERLAAVNTTSLMQTKSQGGFHGLGLLSTRGASEIKEKDTRSSAAVTAQLLLGGPLSIFGDELLKDDGSLVTSSPAKSVQSGGEGVGVLSPSVGRASKKDVGGSGSGALTGASKSLTSSSKKSFTLKRKPFVDHRAVDNQRMKEISTTYKNVGMERNIRTGSNTDLTTLTPALIPFHEVITNIGPPEDMLKSYAGYNAVHDARMKQVNPNTGYVPKSYVPLYVRTTLFETNGTNPGGDQTYATMAKDRRYSAQLGRAMASLEPVPFGKKKKGVSAGGPADGDGSSSGKGSISKFRIK